MAGLRPALSKTMPELILSQKDELARICRLASKRSRLLNRKVFDHHLDLAAEAASPPTDITLEQISWAIDHLAHGQGIKKIQEALSNLHPMHGRIGRNIEFMASRTLHRPKRISLERLRIDLRAVEKACNEFASTRDTKRKAALAATRQEPPKTQHKGVLGRPPSDGQMVAVISYLATAWKSATGKKAGTSWSKETKSREGPFCRFVKFAFDMFDFKPGMNLGDLCDAVRHALHEIGEWT